MTQTENQNPDVLTCLANLSNDEVFTPPHVANAMLDLLPAELFCDPNTTFLDPASKSGVFLREIAKRLIEGLKDKIPDLNERVNHICKNQLFAFSPTELTSFLSRRTLYCSMHAAGKYSVSKFENDAGNIRYSETEHTFKGGKCIYCGAAESAWGKAARGNKESHAYEFIHRSDSNSDSDRNEKPVIASSAFLRANEAISLNKEPVIASGAKQSITQRDCFPSGTSGQNRNDENKGGDNMTFDVIVGNPPYQMMDGGAQASASPIYNKFVEQAKKLKPHYITMIMPARWYAGGKGLDDFRSEMLHDKRIKELHDFADAGDCFTGVDIKGGVCYFLWDRDYSGECKIATHKDGKIVSCMTRPLLENGCDIFIRYNEAIEILRKVQKLNEKSFSKIAYPAMTFGFRTFFTDFDSDKPFENSVKVYAQHAQGYIKQDKVKRGTEYIGKWKVFIPEAIGSGNMSDYVLKPILGEPNTISTETYIMNGPYETKEQAENAISYIKTKFFHFLLGLKKITQHTTQTVYQFVPLQDFSRPWCDTDLYKKYSLSKDEVAFIEAMVREME